MPEAPSQAHAQQEEAGPGVGVGAGSQVVSVKGASAHPSGERIIIWFNGESRSETETAYSIHNSPNHRQFRQGSALEQMLVMRRLSVCMSLRFLLHVSHSLFLALPRSLTTLVISCPRPPHSAALLSLISSHTHPNSGTIRVHTAQIHDDHSLFPPRYSGAFTARTLSSHKPDIGSSLAIGSGRGRRDTTQNISTEPTQMGQWSLPQEADQSQPSLREPIRKLPPRPTSNAHTGA